MGLSVKTNIHLFTLMIFIIGYKNSMVFSQNTFGTISSNYTPTNSVSLNPSSIANSKTFLDINLVGAGTYTGNNLVFVPDNYFYYLLTNLNSIDLKNDIYFDQRILNEKKNSQLFNSVFIAGPGFSCNTGDHAFGLALNGRSYSGVENVPYFIGGFLQHGVSGFSRQQKIDYSTNNIRLSSVGFAELKASYSYTFYKKGKDLLVGGIALKKFNSLYGGALNVNELAFNVQNDTIFNLQKADVDLMRSNFVRYKKGGGGMDIGFTYQRTLEHCDSYLPHTAKSNCRNIPYKYKIGVSLIDIGSVKFDEENTNYKGYNFSDIQLKGYAKFESNPDSVISIYKDKDDFTQGTVTKTNKIQLPTFISAQFDYNIWGSAVYVNTIIVQGISHSKNKFGIGYASSLSITPRFETRLVDFAIPFSLYEYKKPQLGLSFRIGPVTIGTDKLINWIAYSDLYGGDIYVYFKAPMFFHPNCREMILNKRKQARMWKSKIDCAF